MLEAADWYRWHIYRGCTILGFHPPSLFLEHLLIPVGADTTTDVDLPGFNIEDHLPRSLDNLRNLPDFNKIRLRFERCISLEFIGPNGQVCLRSLSSRRGTSRSIPWYLAQFDTSKTVWLEIVGSDPLLGDLHQALHP